MIRFDTKMTYMDDKKVLNVKGSDENISYCCLEFCFAFIKNYESFTFNNFQMENVLLAFFFF